MNDTNDPFFPEGLPRVAPAAGLPAPADRSRPRSLPPALAPLPEPMALLKALRHHWVLALALGIISAALTGAGAWAVVPKPKFTASALIEVKTQSPTLLQGTSNQDRNDYRIFQSTQLARVKSRLVLSAALARPEVAALETIREQEDPTEWLDDHLDAEFQAGSELMRLSLAGKRPQDLAVIVNAVSAAYLDEILTKDHNERTADASKLKSLLDEYNLKLSKQRGQLKQLAESVGSDDKQTLAMKQQIAVQHLATEESELLRVQSERKKSTAEIEVLRAAVGEDPAQGVDEALIEESLARIPEIERLKIQIDELKVKYARTSPLVRKKGDPSVRDIQVRLDNLTRGLKTKRAELRPKVERQLREQLGNHKGDRLAELETQLKILNEYEKVLEQGIKRLQVEAQSFNRQTIDLQWMKDEITQGEETARQLGRQIEALNVELKAAQRGRIVEPADNPRAESPKKRLATIAMATLGAFFCSVLGVSWREYRLRKVDTPEEVVEGLNIRLVGTLPELPGPKAESKRDRGRSFPGQDAARWQNLLVESVDATRTVILRDCRTEDIRTLMITSAVKGEGKSSLSSHLAISLARAGRRTLLVDFDLRSPSIHGLFDVSPSPGVCELLRGEFEIEDVACPVMADLDVIPAGSRDPLAIRALAQDALPALMARLRANYDYVIVDSAPVLPVADSLLIGQHVDAVVISVYRDVSRMPAVYAGHERLVALGIRVLGVVVTGLPAERYGEAYHYDSVPT